MQPKAIAIVHSLGLAQPQPPGQRSHPRRAPSQAPCNSSCRFSEPEKRRVGDKRGRAQFKPARRPGLTKCLAQSISAQQKNKEKKKKGIEKKKNQKKKEGRSFTYYFYFTFIAYFVIVEKNKRKQGRKKNSQSRVQGVSHKGSKHHQSGNLELKEFKKIETSSRESASHRPRYFPILSKRAQDSWNKVVVCNVRITPPSDEHMANTRGFMQRYY